MNPVVKNDYENDTQDALLTLNPDGPIDSIDGWTAVWLVPNPDTGEMTEEDADNSLEINPNDPKMAILRLPADKQNFSARVVATATADKKSTPEVEKLTQVFELSGEHSLATDLGGSAGSVTKGGGFPS